ncbi:hypothetical protein D3C75_608100 [compost metagenome]
MGAISTAVAVLEIKSPMAAQSTNRLASMTRGPISPTAEISPPTMRSTPPVFCNARAKGSMPTIRIRVGQWMDL